METNETKRTVAVVTVLYKERYLTSLVLDDTKTGDMFVEVMRCALNRKGQRHITFRKELRTVYDIDTIFEDLFALSGEMQGLDNSSLYFVNSCRPMWSFFWKYRGKSGPDMI